MCCLCAFFLMARTSLTDFHVNFRFCFKNAHANLQQYQFTVVLLRDVDWRRTLSGLLSIGRCPPLSCFLSVLTTYSDCKPNTNKPIYYTHNDLRCMAKLSRNVVALRFASRFERFYLIIIDLLKSYYACVKYR